MPIELPPLRQRTEDIPALAAHLLERHARAIGRRLPVIGPEALEALLAYPWPGNIRELSNCLERAVLLCDDTVIAPRHLIFQPGVERRPPPPAPPTDNRSLVDVEREHIARVLAACGGNQLRAADVLGIHRNTLRKKLREYDLDTTGSS
ncbi:MAG: sigma-54-dependent Fis family transcriptional regulator [Candidatus Sumerlaeia bacterium]|nr:sigma-54-dependent Fis family transcriptional regulator [Candidatus Sumerlaeia bacterium]